MNFGAFEAGLDGLIDVTTSPGVETRHRQTTAVQKPLPSPDSDYPSSSTQSRDSDDMVSEASKKWTLDLLVFSSNNALSS